LRGQITELLFVLERLGSSVRHMAMNADLGLWNIYYIYCYYAGSLLWYVC